MAKELDVTIDDGGLGLALALAPDKVTKEAGAQVREKSQMVMGIVKKDMPVKYGRARASWGVWNAADLRDEAAARKAGANEADAIWKESPDGLTVTQGSNVPYIEELNNGSSRQMGAGFIDDAAQTGAYLLIKALEDVLGESL